jgi:2-polyprenyl-6-methoxyphenol hydroxylase-like FAD-dependent oxidoreductase
MQSTVVIDRRLHDADLGYALALWPHGTRVLHALNGYDAFIAESEPMLRYALRDSADRLIGSYDMQATIGRFGHLGAIPRPDFIALLERTLEGVEVRNGIGIESLLQEGDHVDVRLSDGAEARFDLVIGADGIHSRVRELLYGRLRERDTGWGCFVWWGDVRLAAKGETTERWGAGNFLGIYPCRDRVCIIAGAPIDALQPNNPNGHLERLKTLLSPYDVPIHELVAGLPADGKPLFLWRMADVRAPRWVEGRVALVSDAAAAFLPTAGIGASMALESAAVLADELSRTDAAHLVNALDLYVKRRGIRVVAAQSQSRWLARVVFLRSRPLVFLRDRLMKLVSMERLVGPLIKGLTEPI